MESSLRASGHCAFRTGCLATNEEALLGLQPWLPVSKDAISDSPAEFTFCCNILCPDRHRTTAPISTSLFSLFTCAT